MSSRTRCLIVIGLFTFAASITSNAQQIQRDSEESAATRNYTAKTALVGKDFMVVAANPYASWAGKRIIEQGGSAIDAAVAIQSMLTLVEPQSSGLGGGAFMLYWDNTSKTLHTFDGREMAPAGVNAYWWMEHGKPVKRLDAVVGGKSVGVPGVLKALEMAHQSFGRLSWQRLFSDAIATAEDGFKVSPRLAKLVLAAQQSHQGVQVFPSTATYFYPAGIPIRAGVLKKNRALGKTLRNIAAQGTDYMYKGPLAKKIAEAVQSAAVNPGVLTVEDMASYKAITRKGVCGSYRDKQICGMAPPSSGGISVYQLLKLLEGFDLSKYPLDTIEFNNLYAQASALTYADRDTYIADSDFTHLPYAALINDSYLSRRARSIAVDKPWRRARPGEPFAEPVYSYTATEQADTSHVVVVDKQGNALTMTTSIAFMFGSGIMVDGFLLNSQLTSFAFNPSKNRFPVPNRVEPHKRPLSAMSPTMVFDQEGNVEILLGTSGGNRIVSYVAQTLIGIIDYGLDVQQAINLPKITNGNDYTALEKDTPLVTLKAPLEALGHRVKVMDLNSGLLGIQITDTGLLGGADPRSEGIAVGK